MVAMRNIASVILLVLGFLAAGHSHDEKKRLLLDSEPSVDIDGKLAQMQAQINAMQTHFENITAALKQENERLKQNVSKGSGSVYVRWGRTVCPSTSSFVYTGYTAGKYYQELGSGTDNLCLPSDPTWSKFVDGLSGLRGFIYGTEIDTIDSDHIFDYAVNQQDMPCVVCRSTNPTVMIPARNNCYPGWTEEYSGYLMAGYHATHYTAYNHVCMDASPEFLQHGSTNDDQHVLYLIEARCGSLPCPPYVDGRELACVVCSK